MTTSILFTHSDGIPVPSVFSVPVAQGDAFELSLADGDKAVIYFSPALAAILSPAPGISVDLIPGMPAQFTFLSSDHGAYSLVAARQSDTAPAHFRTAPSSHVTIDSAFQSANIAFPVDGGRPVSNN